MGALTLVGMPCTFSGVSCCLTVLEIIGRRMGCFGGPSGDWKVSGLPGASPLWVSRDGEILGPVRNRRHSLPVPIVGVALAPVLY